MEQQWISMGNQWISRSSFLSKKDQEIFCARIRPHVKKWGDLIQFKYERKNWSSLMLFNNSHSDCRKLSVRMINSIQPLWLHQFKWTSSIGSIPLEYNHLVGEYDNIEEAKALHYTNGYDNS